MKTKVFLDTNIVIDLLGEREQFYEHAAKIATLADRGEINIVVSALTYPITFYILSRYENREIAKEKLRKFKIISETSNLTNNIVEKALASSFPDFEDSLQYYCALQSNCNFIITRNTSDFKNSELPVMTPNEFFSRFSYN
jgi:predicted nucleic acid-binding protein